MVYCASLPSRTNSVGQLLEEEAMHRLEVEIHEFQLFGQDDGEPQWMSLQGIPAVSAVVGVLPFSGQLNVNQKKTLVRSAYAHK